MICPNCQHENPTGSKFCNQCGASLAVVCPACRHANPPGSRFCNQCGHKLSQSAQPPAVPEPPRARPAPRPQISQEYADKLQSARDSRAMVGERRVVTMLFCDVTGSTAAAEKLDPELWAEIANQIFEHMIGPVYHYEGTVGRLMGDAILAFFGAPIAHEDDPQRAVLAGLDIIAAIQPFRERAAREWGIDLNVRVGINTGLVMVGQVGTDLRMEYTAMGDAINLAARMEQTAQPGTVQISRETYGYIAPFFEVTELGEVTVKGKSAPVQTYRPLRRKSRTDRRRGFEQGDAPLVGRAAELETLVAALTRLESGAGGIVCLLGEAGLGKSRLIREAALRRGIRSADGLEPTPANPAHDVGRVSPVAWLETAALSYESARPYALFQRLLRAFWGIAPADGPALVRDKIALGRPADLSEQEVFQILLGAEAGRATSAREGAGYKQDLYRSMTDLAREESAKRPLVLVFDDLHWADPASVELLIHLLPLSERRPMLIICCMRPDREAPGWQVKQAAEGDFAHRYQEIILHALSEDESGSLVDNLLTAGQLSPASRERILKKTDGNPFFVEEVIRMLIERELIVPETDGQDTRWQGVHEIDDADMPGSLQSMLVARIDRLDATARHTLQLAAVIGRSFYYRVLDAVYVALPAADVDLDDELITLQRKDLIRQAASLPEPEYVFRHALAQEAAYSTILLRRRQTFHRLTGNAIEALFAGALEEFHDILAYHFSRAEDPRAVRYATLAGDAAYRLFAIPEAIRHYSLALELAQSHGFDEGWVAPGDAWSELLTHLFRRHGRCLELRSDFRAAQSNYALMETVAREQDDSPMLLAALQAQAVGYTIPGPAQDADRAQMAADKALALARRLGDRRAEARVLWIFMLIGMYSTGVQDAVPYGEQSAALARELGMSEQLAQSLQDLSRAYIMTERPTDALPVLLEARPLWGEFNNLPMLGENLAIESQIHVMTGDFDAANKASEASLAVANSIDNVWGRVTARAFVVLTYLARGEVDGALANIRPLMADAEQSGHPSLIQGWFYMGWLYLQLGTVRQAKEAARQGLASSKAILLLRTLNMPTLIWCALAEGDIPAAQERLAEADQLGGRSIVLIHSMVLDLVAGEVLLAKRAYLEALQHLDESLGRQLRAGLRYTLPYALRLKSQALAGLGREDEARTTLAEALKVAEAIDNRILRWRILAELGETEAAEDMVGLIAGTIADHELRRTFLDHAQDTINRLP